MTKDEKILVITNGIDWDDTSFEILVISRDVDVKGAYEYYVQQGGYDNFGHHFHEWLIYSRDARELEPDEYEELETL